MKSFTAFFIINIGIFSQISISSEKRRKVMNLLVALDRNGEMVTARSTLCKNDCFYCPSCKRKVCLKVGTLKQPHFAHYRKTACQVFSEGETEEHLQGKLQLATYLKTQGVNVQLEAYLPEVKQRPDILFEKDSQKIVVEFQCSSISIEKVIERTKGYLRANYQVIWILGNNFKYTNKLTAFHIACLYLHTKDSRLFLIHYDAFTDCLSLRYNFQMFKNQQLYCQLNQLNFYEKKIIKLFTQKKSKVNEKIIVDIQSKHARLLKDIRYPTLKMRTFLQLLYQHRENIVSIPKEIYQCLPSDWLIQTHPMQWKFQFILWVEKFPEKTIFTVKMLKLWIDEQIQREFITYYRNPQFTEEILLQPFMEWINFLEKKKFLKGIGDLKWSFQQPLKRYKNLEEKFKNES